MGKTVTLADLEKFEQTNIAVYVPDAFGHLGGAWVHKLSTKTWSKIQSRSRVGADGDAQTQLDQFEGLQFCEAIRTGPEPDAAPVIPLGRFDEVKELVLEGWRRRLILISDALQGYDNSERGKLGNYEGGSIFASGASIDSPASPKKSTSPMPTSTEPTATTAS